MKGCGEGQWGGKAEWGSAEKSGDVGREVGRGGDVGWEQEGKEWGGGTGARKK